MLVRLLRRTWISVHMGLRMDRDEVWRPMVMRILSTMMTIDVSRQVLQVRRKDSKHQWEKGRAQLAKPMDGLRVVWVLGLRYLQAGLQHHFYMHSARVGTG
uniref:Fatty acid metabolism regulator n=1 Tax=Endocarpon pusillum TaxID=364733 RepID=F8QX22_9EURO|nr:fatty acid metabolism regulator [Endocarpon pusillum]